MFLFNDNFPSLYLPPLRPRVFSHFSLDFNIMVILTYFSNYCGDDK